MANKKISPINEDFDFKLMVTIAGKNLMWFVTFMSMAGIIAFLILRYTPPVYEPQTVMKISSENNAQNVLGIYTNSMNNNNIQDPLAGPIELMRSKVIIDRAIRKLPLSISYYSKGTVLVNELYQVSPFTVDFSIHDSAICGVPIMVDFLSEKQVMLSYQEPGTKKNISKTIPLNTWSNLPEFDAKVMATNLSNILQAQKELNRDAFYFVLNRYDNISEQVLANLQVAPLNPMAHTISIKLKEENARKAADIVNGIAREFSQYDVEKNSEVANKILDFIDNTIIHIDTELSQSENSIESFKRKNKIFNPDQAIVEINSQSMNLKQQLLQIEAELDFYDKIRKDIQENNDLGRFLLTIYGKATDSQLLSQLGKLQDLLQIQEQIRLQATEQSEAYKSNALKVRAQQDIIKSTIANEETVLKRQQRKLKEQFGEIETRFGDLPGQQAEFGRLQRLFNINEKFYSLLLEKKAEFSIERAGYVSQHVVLQEARYDSKPVSPNRPLILSACLMIGFIASFVLILVRYLLHNEINALEEIGQYTDAALLGIIPKYKREIPVSQLLVDKNPKSVMSEAFRSIRTNLQFITNEDESKIMAITSTISGEGKTFNAINLAGVIAFSGKKVVIIDLDMRKPKIHLGFNVENNHGISTLLIGKDKPEDCIVHSNLTNLDFITAGPIPPNPAELIINPRMDTLLAYLKERYDIIIIDLPPVGIVSDGIPVMQRADYPIYILRANYSRKMFIIQINKLMAENKVKNLSIILNGVEMSRIKYGYGYGYSYGYGYGYGYSYGYGYYDDDEKSTTLLERVKDYILRKNT